MNIRNKWTVSLMAGAFLLAPTAVLSQQGPRGGFGQSSESIQEVLDLTERQLAELNDLRTEFREQSEEITDQMRALDSERRDHLKGGEADPVMVGSISLQIESLQQQMEQYNQDFREEALALLDSGQRETVEKIQEALELAPKARSLMQYGLLEGFGGANRRGGAFAGGGRGGFGGGGQRGGRPGPGTTGP